MKQKLFTLFLAVMVSLGTIQAAIETGTCGTDLSWSLNTVDSILTIEGTGAMESWNYAGAPWHSFHSNIVKVVLPSGLTSIGDFAFYECENLVSVSIPVGVNSIGFYGFALCSSLPSIEIPDGLTTIGEIAFEGCESLKSVVLGNNITTIGKEAFCTCRHLSKISIPEGVTIIDEMVFAGCPELTSVTIPSTVTTIKAQAFSGCTSLFLEVPDNVSTIGSDAFSSVPNIVCHGLEEGSTWGAKCRNGFIDGFIVYTDETKTTVAACSAAVKTGVALASTVITINAWAFAECFDLTSVKLPEGLTTIENYAFYECRGITSLEIPSSVTSVGESAFVNVGNVVYSGSLDTKYWGAKYMNGFVDGYYIYTDDSKTTLAVCSNAARGSISVPTSVTTLKSRVFVWCTNITSVTIPETVVTYEDNLFGACSSLESVHLPSNIPYITEYMFNGSGLRHIDIPESVTSIGVYAFGWCDKLRSITFPNNAGLTIHDNAFASCLHLQKIISNAVNPPTIEAEGEVFYGVDKSSCILYVPEESIELYQMAPEWGGFNIQAIQNEDPTPCITASGTCGAEGDNLSWELSCEGVLTIKGTGAMYDYLDWNSPWREYKDDIKSVIVEEGVTTIGYAAFRDHGHLQQCSLPSTITSIGEEAFCFCFQLMSIEIPDACTSFGSASFNLVPNVVISDASILPYNGSARSVNGFVEGYFVYADATKHSLRACSSAVSGEIALDDAVERIEYMAFAQCEEITNIQFGSHLQYIGEWSLNGCIGLESLAFQEGLIEIASNAFGNCFGLRTVSLPNSLTTVENFAIGNCPVLRTIHFGTSLTTIGAQFFDSCPMIESIYTPMTTPPVLGEGSFAGTNLSNVTCYVPYESLSLYQQAPIWKEMNLQATEAPDPCITASGTCGAEGDNLTWELSCEGVLTISGIGEMGDYSYNTTPWYEYFESIFTIVIEDGVTSIADNIFLHYNNLSAFNVTEGNPNYHSIDGVLFDKEVTTLIQCPIMKQGAYIIPEGVTIIESAAFGSCSNLTSLEIPSSVNGIGGFAFNGCSGLNSFTCKAITPPALGLGLGDANIFDGIDKSIPLYVPFESVSVYQTTNRWKEFTNILPIPGTEPQKVTITWQDEDGNPILEEQVEVGTTPVFSGETPTKAATNEYTYEFAGWLPKIKPATEDVRYTTFFERNKIEKPVYTVNINGENCSLNISNECPEGTKLTVEAVADECFEFQKWSDNETANPRTINVTEDTDLTAEFNKVRYTITGKAENEGGQVQVVNQ